MGAHVWWPKFLADNWFPKFRLVGLGARLVRGLPGRAVLLPDPGVDDLGARVVMPYNVAFKLVTVSGPLMLPAAGTRSPRA